MIKYPNKEESVTARLDSEEKRLLEKLCKATKLRPSAVMRLALHELAKVKL